MVTICRDWTPRDDLRVCNNFIADYITTIAVDRDGDTTSGPYEGSTTDDATECDLHGTNIEEANQRRGASIYEDIAWNHGFGFCGNCWMATQEVDNYECEDCNDTYWPWGEDPDEEDEDNEEETTATQAAAFIRARQRRTEPDPGWRTRLAGHPTSRIHALSIPHGA